MISFAPLQIILAARQINDRYTHKLVGENWPFGSFMCSLYHVVLYVNMFVQIIFLTLMAIDRYLAVVRHGRLMKLSSYRNSKPVIGEFINFLIIFHFIKLPAVCLPGRLDQYFHIQFGQELSMKTKLVVWIGTMSLITRLNITKNAWRLSTKSLTEQQCIRTAHPKAGIIHLISQINPTTFRVINIWIWNSIQGYASGGPFAVCSCGVPNAFNNYNMHMLVWMFIIPFIIILFSYGNIASVIYNSTKRTSSHRERISSENGRSGHSRFQKIGSSSKIDPRTKRLLLLIIALVVR